MRWRGHDDRQMAYERRIVAEQRAQFSDAQGRCDVPRRIDPAHAATLLLYSELKLGNQLLAIHAPQCKPEWPPIEQKAQAHDVFRSGFDARRNTRWSKRRRPAAVHDSANGRKTWPKTRFGCTLKQGGVRAELLPDARQQQDHLRYFDSCPQCWPYHAVLIRLLTPNQLHSFDWDRSARLSVQFRTGRRFRFFSSAARLPCGKPQSCDGLDNRVLFSPPALWRPKCPLIRLDQCGNIEGTCVLSRLQPSPRGFVCLECARRQAGCRVRS
jgi:hypothetical protein